MPNLNKAYQWWINTCNAPNVGYSQKYRNQQTINGITYYDCSSFIWYGLLAGGFDCVGANNGDSWPFWTGSMGAVLQRLGFTVLPASSFPSAMKGDICIHSGVHTEAVFDIENGGSRMQTMGAHTGGIPLDDQVSINGYFQSYTAYPEIARLGAGGATGYGCTPYVVAALCGNAWGESTVNSGRHQTTGSAFGMFQWDGGRKTNLLNWLSQHGYSADDPIGQLEFLVDENDWIADSESRSLGINSLTDFLSSTITDIHQLTRLFCNCWERPGIPRLQERYDFADKAYPYIINNGNTGAINTWFISADALGEEQALNNSVLIYRFFSTGGGGGWPNGMPPRYKHKMPVWMMTRKIYC